MESCKLFSWTPCTCLFFKLRLHFTKWTLEQSLSLLPLFLFQNGTVLGGPQHFNSSGLAETERDLHKLHLRCRAAKGFSSYDLNFRRRRLALLFSSRPPQFPPKGIAIFASFLHFADDKKDQRVRPKMQNPQLLMEENPVSPFFNAHRKFWIWSIKRSGKSPKRFFGHIIIPCYVVAGLHLILASIWLGGDRFYQFGCWCFAKRKR